MRPAVIIETWRKRAEALARGSGRIAFGASESSRLLLVGTAMLAAFYLQGLALPRAIENRLFDLQVKGLAGQHVISSDIVLVAIDEDSLSPQPLPADPPRDPARAVRVLPHRPGA